MRENRPQPETRLRVKTKHTEIAPFTPLFSRISDECFAALDNLPAIIDGILPLNATQRRNLPQDISELSLLFTAERGARKRPYWSRPAFISAYLRYFMPWNLIRIAHILPALALPVPLQKNSAILDIGSGPLTLPIALWLGRPDWREIPLTIICADSAIQPLELGKAVFARIAKDNPWQIRLLRSPLHKAIQETRGQPLLLTAANVLNEIAQRGDMRLSDYLDSLLADISHKLAPGGAVLCLEPGTRLGGTLLARLRARALDQNFFPHLPCTHAKDCPLIARRDRGWCHTVMETDRVPNWLKALTQQAGLDKHSISLSALLLSAALPEQKTYAGRVLSSAFMAPGLGLSRYACTREGLALLLDAAPYPQGDRKSVV
jgi:ribosomal protein RSM22 (predicted rRNA methylase)